MDNFTVGLSVGIRHGSLSLWANVVISSCNASGAYVASHGGAWLSHWVSGSLPLYLAALAFGGLAGVEYRNYQKELASDQDDSDNHLSMQEMGQVVLGRSHDFEQFSRWCGWWCSRIDTRSNSHVCFSGILCQYVCGVFCGESITPSHQGSPNEVPTPVVVPSLPHRSCFTWGTLHFDVTRGHVWLNHDCSVNSKRESREFDGIIAQENRMSPFLHRCLMIFAWPLICLK